MASGLSIVIDTRNAELNIKNLNQALERLETQGNSVANMMRNLGGANPFAGLTASITQLKDGFNDFAGSTNTVKTAIKNLADGFTGAKTAIDSATTAINAFNNSVKKVYTSADILTNKIGALNGGFTVLSQKADTASSALSRFAQNATTASSSMGGLISQSHTLAQNMANMGAASNAGANNTGTALARVNGALSNTQAQMNGFNNTARNTQNTFNQFNANIHNTQNNFTQLNSNINLTRNNFTQLNNTVNNSTTVINNYSHSLNNAANNASNAARSTLLFRRSAQGLEATLMRLQTLMTGGLFGMAALSVLKTADAMQTLDNQVRIVTKSTEERLAVENEVHRIANANYTDIKTTTDIYHRNALAMASMGASQKDVLRFTDNMSLAMRTSGRTITEQNSALYQWSQAMGAGKLQGQEFRIIALAVPSLLKYISAEMGVTVGQLKKLGAEGKITGEVMVKSVEKARPELEELASQMPMTMSQAFTVANNEYKLFIDKIMNGTGGASQTIASMIYGIGKNFDALANIAIAGAGVAMLGFANRVLFAGSAFAKLTTIMKANPLFLIASVVIGASIATRGFDETIRDLGNTLGVLGSVLGDVIGFFGDLANTAYTAFSGILTNANETADGSNQVFGGFFADTGTGFQGFLVGTVKVFDAIAVTVRSTAQYCGERFGKMVIDISNFFITLSNNVKTAFAGVVNHVVDSINESIKGINGLIEQANSKTIFGYGLNIGTMGMVGRYTPNLGQTKPSLPVSYQDIYDGNAERQQTSGLQQYFQGKFDSQAKSTKALTGATGDLNKMMDANAYAMHKTQKAIDDKATADKAAAKAAKEHAKAQRELSNGARLVGVSGNTGRSTGAHLDIRVSGGGRRLTDAELARFQAGGKNLSAYTKTSEYGSRVHPITGKRHTHGGIDFAMPEGTPITTKAAIKDIKSFYDSKGGGYVQRILFADGLSVDLLHQSPKAQGIKGGASTGIAKLDGMMSKLDNAYDRQVEKATREREQLEQKRLDIRQKYGTKEKQLEAQLTEDIKKIKEAKLPQAEETAAIKQATANMKRELKNYKTSLVEEASQSMEFSLTTTQQLINERRKANEKAMNDPELSKPENAKYLQQRLDSIKAEFDYKDEVNRVSLEKQRNELTAYQKDERQLLADNWDSQIDEARLKFDGLSDIRIGALKAQKDRALEIFDLEQSQKLLDLQKFNMADIAYFEQTLRIKNDLVDKSNATQAMKDAQKAANNYQNRKDVLGVFKNQPENLDRPMFFGKGAEGQYQEAMYNAAETIRVYSESYATLEQMGLTHSQVMTDLQTAYSEKVRQDNEAIMASERAVAEERFGIMSQVLGMADTIWSSMTDMVKKSFGEQSAAARAMFFVQKGIAAAQAIINTEVAATKAMAEGGFIMGIPMSTAIRTLGYASAGIIAGQGIAGLFGKGFSTGGYTGNMGVNDIAGVVHGKEYVVNARNTVKYRDTLEQMNRGTYKEGSGVNVNIINNAGVPVQQTQDSNGDIRVIIGEELAKQLPQHVNDEYSDFNQHLKRKYHIQRRL